MAGQFLVKKTWGDSCKYSAPGDINKKGYRQRKPGVTNIIFVNGGKERNKKARKKGRKSQWAMKGS